MPAAHSIPAMTNRVIELSVGKPRPNKDKDSEFRNRILKEWIEVKDEKGHLHKRVLEEEQTVPCVCGRTLKSGYFDAVNVNNGNAIRLGTGCIKYIRNHDLQQLTRKQIKQKITENINKHKYDYFKNNTLDDWTKTILYELCDEWGINKNIKYLKWFQHNKNVREIFIDKIQEQTIAKKEKYNEEFQEERAKKIEYLQENKRLKAEIYDLKTTIEDNKTIENNIKFKHELVSDSSDDEEEERCACPGKHKKNCSFVKKQWYQYI